jgi:hypothetical protein
MRSALLASVCLALASLTGGVGAQEESADQAQLLRDITVRWKGFFAADTSRPERPVIQVGFGCSSKVDDAALAELKRLPDLQFLGISGDRVTDTGLAHLKELKNLRRLALYTPRVTDAGLEHLNAPPRLRHLEIGRVPLTGKGLRPLKEFPALKTLIFSDVRLGDEALHHLKGMRQLETLYIHASGLSDAQVRAWKEALPQVTIEVSK